MAAHVQINIDISSNRQQIDGLGGNFAIGRYNGCGFINDKYGIWNLENSNVEYARIGIPLGPWEPENDNKDAFHINWDKFVDSKNKGVHNIFLRIKDIYDRGIPVILSSFDAPAWMLSNADELRFHKLKSGMEDEFVECITAYVLYLKKKYGVEVEYFGFNEVNGGFAKMQFTARENARICGKLGERFEKHGIETKLLVGEAHSIRKEEHIQYLKDVWNEFQSVQKYFGGIAYHSWKTVTDWQYREVGRFAKSMGQKVLCTEVGVEPEMWCEPEPLRSWWHAREVGLMYARMISLSRASIITYWEYQDDYPLCSENLQAFPVWYAVKHYAANFKPGMIVVECSSSDEQVKAVSATDCEGGFVLNIHNALNDGEENYVQAVVEIEGLPEGSYCVYTSDNSGRKLENMGSYVTDRGRLEIPLEADSINTLKLIE
jgi:O-glycosyl hydrolase